AMLTYHLVEEPVRRAKVDVRSDWGSYRIGAATLAVVLAVAGAWQLTAVQKANFVPKEDDPRHPGAAVLEPGGPQTAADADPIPPYAALPKQFDNFTEQECRKSDKNEIVVICTDGVTDNPS